MKKLYILAVISALFFVISCKQSYTVKYPVTRKVDTVNTYFGVKIHDPYRWLENDTSKETANWIQAQNSVTFDYLSKIPFREKIREQLTKIWNYPKLRVPFHEGPYYFFFKNDGLQNQYVLYFRKGLQGEPNILLDPNKLSTDGTIALSSVKVSHDGKFLAYSISHSGSDWNEVYIMEIETQKILPEHLQWVKFPGIAWKGDGFYYNRFPEPTHGGELSEKNANQTIWFHKVGTDQQADQLIYENRNFPLRRYRINITDDERFLILYESESTSGNALYYKDLKKKEIPFTAIIEGFDNEYSIIDNLDDKLLVVTNYLAPKKKLVLIDPMKPLPGNWKIIIPEREDVLQSVDIAGNKIISEYMQFAMSRAYVYDMNGKFLEEIHLPGLGTFSGFNGRKGDNIAFYGYSTFRYPTTVFKYEVTTNTSTVYTRPEIDFNPDLYEAKQVSYLTRDRTSITMFLVYKKGLKLNGQNPTLLYGYGGFNVNMTPVFNVSRTVFLENGGIYAVPNLRGGGEYGENWHKAGIKEKKQNVFDDFIAAAEYLISENYTSPAKLAILGGSNGGLLVGACMTQRPDLFKVAIPQVGLFDMLRYHKFTIGYSWKSDYGSSETMDGFNYLIKYSPLHNLKKGVNYPATLAFTADHDDRVVPAHTFKFMATLQEANNGQNPMLVRIEIKAGHGAGTPTSKQIEESTDLWSFVFFNLGMKLE
ncbi:MAG: prolyl oligopeptidase family serine peptidase [Bacteroidetes bacterium]|nr:prolyl oligopeptidase family serine peptidase [Bacteroidota bacterium]